MEKYKFFEDYCPYPTLGENGVVMGVCLGKSENLTDEEIECHIKNLTTLLKPFGKRCKVVDWYVDIRKNIILITNLSEKKYMALVFGI